jgi:hypothetical protein
MAAHEIVSTLGCLETATGLGDDSLITAALTVVLCQGQLDGRPALPLHSLVNLLDIPTHPVLFRRRS